ncbi:hypothetical protein EH228_05220 [Erwinia endophytica]|uniref:hypothetical protein n=1 Tax=Erwinia endophytica TaxID=1563158 RepID=UPI001265DDEB|nr:hypothetical protein [Erwinia endophytica]KAB8312891.1 hypothetical protein EH228_05220 [Erwinia endophytica]
MGIAIIPKITRAIKYLSPALEIITTPTGHTEYSTGSAYTTGGTDLIDSALSSHPDICANPYLLIDFDNNSKATDEYGIRRNELSETYIANSNASYRNSETIKYFQLRKRKKIAKSVTVLATTPANVHTAGVSVTKATLSLSSFATSALHRHKLKKISNGLNNHEGFKQYDEFSANFLKDNLNYIIKIKRNKSISTLINTALSVVPGKEIHENYKEINYALSLAKTAFDDLTSKGIHVDGINNEIIMRVAMAIHYLANRDLKTTLRIHNSPAAMVFEEIFTQRGISSMQQFYKKYDVVKLIKEPAGWLALADKLSL